MSELFRHADIHITRYTARDVSLHTSVVSAIGAAYTESFAQSEWDEQHHQPEQVAERILADLQRSPYAELLSLTRDDGTILAAGWQGGGLSAPDLTRWLLESYEMTEQRTLPDRLLLEETLQTVLLEEGRPKAEAIMNTADFFVVPSERAKIYTARLMSYLGKSAHEAGMTHYLGWTRHDSMMHGMMTGRGAIVAAKFFDQDTEFHVLLGAIDALVGRVSERLIPQSPTL